MGSRYGGLKQLDGLGPNGETIMDYSIYDAIRQVLERSYGSSARISRSSSAPRFSLSTRVISPVSYVWGIDALPEGFKVPEGRVKPWGTNHAVLMGKGVIKEPFCVINCDDFYNRDAFMVIGKFLSSLPEGAKNQYAMVGFRVGNTLSENGTVARGICSKNEKGHLTTVVERTEIVRCAEDGSQEGAASQPIRYRDENGKWVVVDDNTPVSMNMWGFTPDYFDYSEEYFKEFLSDPKNMENLKAEFFIPLMVNKLITDKTATVEVLDTTSKWFGVTYAADREDTVKRIQKLVDDGVYPNKLF